jgi:hypothetical protein
MRAAFNLQFATANPFGQVMGSHDDGPFRGYQSRIRAQQITQDPFGVDRVEVLGGLVEQHDPGR